MKILPVISTKGGEGKSTQAANLCGFLADAGLKTLLIDGDFGQPTELMKSPDRNLQIVKGLLGHRSITTTMGYIDINLDVTCRTLESELGLYLDKY